MKNKYDFAKKQAVISRYKSGEAVAHIVQDMCYAMLVKSYIKPKRLSQ